MNEGERKALLTQVEIRVNALQKSLAQLGVPVSVVLLRQDTATLLTQSELVELAEKR